MYRKQIVRNGVMATAGLMVLLGVVATGAPIQAGDPAQQRVGADDVAPPAELRLESGTLIVCGEVFEAPFTLLRSEKDVLVNGKSVNAAMAKDRAETEARAAANPTPPESAGKYARQHATIKEIFAKYHDLVKEHGSEAAPDLLAAFAKERPGIRAAAGDSSELVIEWDDGDSEHLLLQPRRPTLRRQTTEEIFHAELDRYVSTLRRHGIVALGTNYVTTGTGSEADGVRDLLRDLKNEGIAGPEAIRMIEERTGNRSFAEDYVHVNTPE